MYYVNTRRKTQFWLQGEFMSFNSSDVPASVKELLCWYSISLFRYLNVYQKYSSLLDHTAKQEISAFLKEKHSLEGFTKVIKLFRLKSTLNISFFFSWHWLSTCFAKVLPLSIFRKLRALITCGQRLPHCPFRCPCPCFVCMLASWMMTCVTVLKDWKTRSSRSRWKRTESLTRGERRLSASLTFVPWTAEIVWLIEHLISFVCVVQTANQLCVYLNLKRENDNHKLFFSRICQKYEEIKETIRCTPETTEELVSLNQYIKKTSDVTIHKLIDEIDEAAYRLCFLLDYATLPCM